MNTHIAPRMDALQRQGTYDRLLATALESYMANGYQKTNLRDMAKSLGLSATAVYHHFRSKEDLLATAYEDHIHRLLELHDGLVGAMPPPEQLWVFAAAHLRIQFPSGGRSRESRQIFLIQHLLPFVGAGNEKKLKRAARRLVTKLESIIHRGVSEGCFACENPTFTAFSILAASHNAPSWFSDSGTLSLQDLMALCADQALRLVGHEAPEDGEKMLSSVTEQIDQHYRPIV